MSKTLFILGRQPAIGIAELESLIGAESIQLIANSSAVIVTKEIPVPFFDRLGGSIKAVKILHTFTALDWRVIEKYLLETLPERIKISSSGKVTIGLSAYGMSISQNQLMATGLTMKKKIKSLGRSVRLVPNKKLSLSSAQIIHNRLTTDNGWEFVLVKDGPSVILGITTAEQDITAYTARDQLRPNRDARVGMLPPKLAQIILNLANPKTNGYVLDPFCGTGVILQEALRMGFSAYGTDLDQRMIEYTKANLQWFSYNFRPKCDVYTVQSGDATTMHWEKVFTTISTETYLGRPFSHQPDKNILEKVIQDVDTIHQKFLQNLATQTNPGFRFCIAVPAWHTFSGVRHLKILDSLEKLGYNRIRFSHVDNKDLVYHREGQIVGRELVVLQRK